MKLTETKQAQLDLLAEESVFDDNLYEMANLDTDDHGIDDVVIWVGRTDGRHGLRVKVSNKKGKFDDGDCFVIQMPSLDYDPTKVALWITTKHLRKIFEWIKLNQDLLYAYEKGELQSTRKFLNKIVKI